jgi:hypothetical protein
VLRRRALRAEPHAGLGVLDRDRDAAEVRQQRARREREPRIVEQDVLGVQRPALGARKPKQRGGRDQVSAQR